MENERHLPYKIKPSLLGEKISDAIDIENNSDNQSGALSGSVSQQEINDITDASLDSAIITFQGSLIARDSNVSNWFNGTKRVFLQGERGQPNGNYRFTIPDADALNAAFDVLESKSVDQVITFTIDYEGGSSSFINRNSLTIQAPSVSVGFDRNEIPTTLTQGSSVIFRIERVNGIINQWERVSVTESPNVIGAFGDIELQNLRWNNTDLSLLPTSAQVQKGYAFEVVGSESEDGKLRQGLVDSGVDDKVIYDGDWVVWKADAFTSWTNKDDWFILSADDVRRISQAAANFLTHINETDTRIDLGNIENNGASNGLVWLSPVVMDRAPFLDPNIDTGSTPDGNPRPNADGQRYLGGTFNRSEKAFQYGANFFNSYLYLGITPNFVTVYGAENIFIVVYDDNNDEIVRYNLNDDFTFIDDATFTNGTVRHYIFGNGTTFNYASLQKIEIILTQEVQNFNANGNVDFTSTVNNLDISQMSQEAQNLFNKIRNLNDNSNQPEDFSSIINRISKLDNVQNLEPYEDTYFAQSNGSDSFPNASSLTQVSPQNPIFTVSNTDIFIYVEGGSDRAYMVQNTTQGTATPLDTSIPNVDLGASTIINGKTFFGYRVSGLTANDVLEVFRVTFTVEANWERRISQNESDIKEDKATLNHAVLDIPEPVVNVLRNETTVTEEDNATRPATDYNKQLAGGSNATQTVFYEATPNLGSGGFKNSKLISDTKGTDRYRNKLIYFTTNVSYSNQVYLSAFDGATNRDLITYENGIFNAKVLVPEIPAGTSTQNVPLRFNQSLLSERIVHSPVEGHPESAATFSITGSPSDFWSRSVSLNWNDEANGNPQNSGTIDFNSSISDQTYTLVDGNITITVRLFRDQSSNQIDAEVTFNVSASSLTEYAIVFSGTYEDVRTVPFTPSTVRNVEIERLHDGFQVFAIKASTTGTLILVGDRREIDTGYTYISLFGATEDGYLTARSEDSTFLDYQDFQATSTIITDLENHATLTQFNLFSTLYTHKTVLHLDTQLEVKNSFNDALKVGDELILKSTDGTKRFQITVKNDESGFDINEIT